MAMTETERVRTAQARAQARDDAKAIEMKKVKAFLRLALPENAVLPGAKKKKVRLAQSVTKRNEGQPFRMKESKVMRGKDYVESTCTCPSWEKCSKGCE